MSATISNKKETIFGTKRIMSFDVALGSYTGGSTGVSVTPAMVGMRKFDIVLIEPGTDGYLYEYDYTNSSIKAYVGGGDFPITISAPAITVSSGASVTTVSGPNGSDIDLYLSTATATGILTKNEATDRTIPLSTLGMGMPSAVLATAPTFPATTCQTAMAEFATGSLSTACHCIAIGD